MPHKGHVATYFIWCTSNNGTNLGTPIGFSGAFPDHVFQSGTPNPSVGWWVLRFGARGFFHTSGPLIQKRRRCRLGTESASGRVLVREEGPAARGVGRDLPQGPRQKRRGAAAGRLGVRRSKVDGGLSSTGMGCLKVLVFCFCFAKRVTWEILV